MSDIAIRVENIGKQYRIGAKELRHDTLRDQIMHGMTSMFRPAENRSANFFWALHDVSFELREGEVLGIIGRNGAGKSTLLKILSRITQPTTGRAVVRGSLGSLLEVGTGFHPELTGRENVFLNGSILGMARAEVARKFDEIVSFAEIEKFIDTPVKRYSSGMYVRLGFAVAAHLEFDILVVDEVLAVGDVAFQEKCLNTMQRSASSGRTVLFVSHNMASVQHLCSRAILLEKGCISAAGKPSDVISHYLSAAHKASTVPIGDWQDRVTTDEARILQIDIMNSTKQHMQSIPVGGSVCFSILAYFREPIVDPCFGVLVHGSAGEPMLDIRSSHAALRLGRVHGMIKVDVAVENVGLYPGRYFLSPWITDSADTRAIDWVKLCCMLEVHPAPGPSGDLRLDPQWGKYWVPSVWSRAELDTREEGGIATSRHESF